MLGTSKLAWLLTKFALFQTSLNNSNIFLSHMIDICLTWNVLEVVWLMLYYCNLSVCSVIQWNNTDLSVIQWNNTWPILVRYDLYLMNMEMSLKLLWSRINEQANNKVRTWSLLHKYALVLFLALVRFHVVIVLCTKSQLPLVLFVYLFHYLNCNLSVNMINLLQNR